MEGAKPAERQHGRDSRDWYDRLLLFVIRLQCSLPQSRRCLNITSEPNALRLYLLFTEGSMCHVTHFTVEKAPLLESKSTADGKLASKSVTPIPLLLQG